MTLTRLLAAPSRWGYFASMRGALLVLGLALAALPACRAKVPVIDAPFSDDFDRAELGPTWHATSPEYRIVGGKLEVANAHNRPAWLRRRLPATSVKRRPSPTRRAPRAAARR